MAVLGGRARLVFLALSLSLAFAAASSCRRSDGGGTSGPEAPWDLVNTADGPTFAARLAEMRLLTDAALRAGLPVAETRDAGALSECADDVGVFGLKGTGPSALGGFKLTDGQSCGDAVRTIKSFYAQALDAAGLTVGRFGRLKPGGVLCGFRSDENAVDPKLAAVSYKLTPLDQPDGATFEQGLMGGADATRVGVLSIVHATCDKVLGDCGGAPGMQLDGTSRVFANVESHALDLENVMVYRTAALDPNAGHDVVTEVTSTLAVTGLEEGGKIVAHETATYASTPAVAGAATSRVSLTLAVDELSAGRLRLTGNVTPDAVGSEVPVPQEFAVELRRQGDLCRVMIGTEPAPAPVFDPTTIPGVWERPCASGDLGRWGERFSVERWQLETDGAMVHTLTAFDDQECFPGHEAARIVVTGTFAVGAELAPLEGGALEIGIDFTRRETEVMLVSPDLVSRFNDSRLCDRDDWAQGLARSFDAGHCYFDLGSGAQMSTLTLKRKTEFLSFKPEPPTVIGVARSAEFSGMSQERRTRVDGAGVRFSKVSE